MVIRKFYSNFKPGRSFLASFFLVISLSFLLISCASYTTQTKKMRQLFRGGSTNEALAALDESDLASAKQSRFLYLVERATLLDQLGQKALAHKHWEEAFRLSEKLYTTSISKEVATYIINDAMQDYRGEDYERVFVPLMKSLSYLDSRKKQKARVEARRVNLLLKEINGSYDNKKNRYSEDAFAMYLSGLILEANGDLDNALVSYKKSLDSYEGAFGIFSEGPPQSLVGQYLKLANQLGRKGVVKKITKDYPQISKKTKKNAVSSKTATVIVTHQVGFIPMKRQSEFVFSVGSQIVRASFPVIRPTSYGSWFGSPSVKIGKKIYQSELATDLGQIAAKTLEDQRGRMILKHGARLLAKGQIAEQARQNYGEAAGLLVNVFNLFTETADTRSWTTLPERIYLTKFQLKPGKHTIQTSTEGDLKNLSLNVKAGQTIFLNHRP